MILRRNRRSIDTSLRIRKQQHQLYQITNPNAYCMDLQRTSKIQGTRIERKGLSPTPTIITQYNILKYRIFFFTKTRNKFYIPQSLGKQILSWYHEY
jgi:hypothetical protein